MEFPMFVYRDGGPHSRKGGTFSFRQVIDKDRLQESLDTGWRINLDDTPALQPASQPAQDDSRPASRDELEVMATRLGIPFSARVSNKQLRALIDERKG